MILTIDITSYFYNVISTYNYNYNYTAILEENYNYTRSFLFEGLSSYELEPFGQVTSKLKFKNHIYYTLSNSYNFFFSNYELKNTKPQCK